MNFSLNIITGEGTREEYLINKPVTYIGRSRENDIVLKDENVSKKHVKIVLDKDHLEIYDLKSKNGVFVNDKKIKEKNNLKPGDSVRLGHTKFEILEVDDESSNGTVILHSLSLEAEYNLDRHRLKIIYEITTDLAGNQNVKVLGDRIFSKIKKIFRQDHGYLALFEANGALRPICLDSPDEPVPLSRSIVDRLFQNGESFLLEDALSDVALKEQESVLALKIRSALCAPLIFNNQILGMIYLDRGIPGAYKQEDLEFLKSIGSILAPLIENARLWTELKERYADTVETLKETQASLIEAERTAAYVKLAHAMAHEIRNPLMVIGGLVRKRSRSGSDNLKSESLDAIVNSVERVESVLKEVDSFVKIPLPEKKLHRIDDLIKEEIECYGEQCKIKALRPLLTVNTSHVMIPLDAGLIRKALSMIFKEILFCIPDGSDINILINESGNELEIVFGEVDKNQCLCNPFDPEIRSKPWSLGLFLNIAHKILSDHGGKLLLDPMAHSAYPIVIKLPKSMKVETSMK